MRHPYGVSVTVKRATANQYGDPVVTSTHTVEDCVIAPRSSTEQLDRRDIVITGLSLWAPADADILATDVITLPDGTDWQVDGLPGVWTTPFTAWRPGIEVALKRVTG